MHRVIVGYLIGAAGVSLAVLVLLPFRQNINSTPVALMFLLVVLFIAVWYGRGPAMAVAVASMLCFNFFFLPPYYVLTIADPQNWVALGAFLITALIVGGVSTRERRRTEEVRTRNQEIERLHTESREALALANQAEAVRQSEQLKSALLDAVSHDLRTPLTSMKAAVTTLLDNIGESESSFALDEEGRRELLEVINAEIDRLNHLLEGLIEIAKIEAGAMQPRRAWSNMEEIVAISLSRAAGITSHHRIRLDIEKDLPPVRADEKAVAEVLYILIENATKYSPANTDILVSVHKTGEDALKVSVEDRGAGVPAELREKVFEKFFRFSQPDAASRPTGLGMGLAIARGIIQAHKGRIWIEDTASGRGTRISFLIPLTAQTVSHL